MTKPLISICVPAFNVANYIAETISCLLKQSYQNIEIIIVNDGSTDDTLNVLEQINSNKIKVISVANGGAAKARNIAYQSSTGAYIIFLDADDLLSGEFIENQMLALNGDDHSIVIASWGRFYKSIKEDFVLDNDLIIHPFTLEDWICTNWLLNKHNTPPGRMLIPRKVLNLSGIWDDKLSLNDDFEFFTRVALNSNKIIPNFSSTYYYRSGIGGLSSYKGEKAYLSLFKSFKQSFDLCLKAYPQNQKVKKACANLWRSYIYETYPLLPDKRNFADKEIINLGGSNLKIPTGGITKYLNIMLGWKKVKLLKKYLS